MGSSRFNRKVAIGLLAGATVVGLSLTAGSATAAPQGRYPLNGSTPRWLPQAHDMGASTTSQQVNFGILLGLRDQAGAVATLQAISDPASARYGQWLSNADFDARYAPTSASVAAVQSWLHSEGFQVTTTLPSGMYVEASGSVSTVQSIFGTSLHNYSYLGKEVRANASQLSPAGQHPSHGDQRDQRGGRDRPGLRLERTSPTSSPGRPMAPGSGCSRARRTTPRRAPLTSCPPTANHSRTPYAGTCLSNFQSAYGESRVLSSGVNGGGVTVAITDA